MREFFAGWRRKAGCGTLLLACLFEAIWMRSQFAVDIFEYDRAEKGEQILAFFPEGIEWTSRRGRGLRIDWPTILGISWKCLPTRDVSSIDESDGWDVDEHWEGMGFRFGKYHLGGPLVLAQRSVWRIPYSAVVLPLILVSASLILKRPASNKPGPNEKKGGEP